MSLYHQVGMKHASKASATRRDVDMPLRADVEPAKQQQQWQAGCQLLASQQGPACPCRTGASLASCRAGGPLTSPWQGILCASRAKGWAPLSIHRNTREFCTGETGNISQHAPLI